MIKLSRETRFALVPPNGIPEGKPSNSWAGWPSTNLIVPHLMVRIVLEGEHNSKTGYLVNIKLVDELIRKIVTRRLIPVFDGTQTAEHLLRLIYREWNAEWEHESQISELTLVVTPFLNYSIMPDPNMNATAIRLTQQFEFSAAHRLHCDDLSDEENQKLFGKCNNPEGHGHNYLVEVTVSREVDSDKGQVVSLSEFESTVKRIVIDRLDHKHLNRDVEYFESVNPSVENIAVAIFDWLDGQVEPATLETIRVYETPKTWAEQSRSS